jgi:hypothetical protein
VDSFIAECFWPDVSPEQVGERAAQLQHDAAGMSVRFVGAILVPDDDVVFYLFDDCSAAAVREVCRRAAIPVDRIVRSVRLGADGS